MASDPIIDAGFQPTHVILGGPEGTVYKPGELIGYSGGAWVKANAAAGSGIEAFYIVGQAGVAGDRITVYRSVNLIDLSEPFTPGSKIWVSPTIPGAWTHTQPTTLGDMIQFLGVASSGSKATLHCGMGVGAMAGILGLFNDPNFYLTKLGASPGIVFDVGDQGVDAIWYWRQFDSFIFNINGRAVGGLTADHFSQPGYITFPAISKPTTPSSGQGYLYAKTVSGKAHPIWIDAAAAEYDLLDSQASNGVITSDLAHSGAHAGFFGATPIVQPDAYTPSNVTPDRSFDANATSIDEIADVLGTLIADLKAYGLLK
jgi:hypothetical protein